MSRRKGKKTSSAGFPAEYSLLLTATMILLAFGIVMVFSASSTSQILSNGSLAGSTEYLKKTLIAALIGLRGPTPFALRGTRGWRR